MWKNLRTENFSKHERFAAVNFFRGRETSGQGIFGGVIIRIANFRSRTLEQRISEQATFISYIHLRAQTRSRRDFASLKLNFVNDREESSLIKLVDLRRNSFLFYTLRNKIIETIK